jgi:hypothetical protein
MRMYMKGLLAVLVGFVIGSLLNMALIMLSGHVIPPPPGVDVTTTEGLKAGMGLFSPRHFLFPFLAHALGTLAGAFVATKIVGGGRWVPAAVVGALFFAGGVAATFMLPAPVWFSALDLLAAYAPFAWLGYQLAWMKPRS